MDSKISHIEKKKYIRPGITRVIIDTSLVLMQPSLPTHHHGHTTGTGSKGPEEPTFQSPFGDKPFS